MGLVKYSDIYIGVDYIFIQIIIFNIFSALVAIFITLPDGLNRNSYDEGSLNAVYLYLEEVKKGTDIILSSFSRK